MFNNEDSKRSYTMCKSISTSTSSKQEQEPKDQWNDSSSSFEEQQKWASKNTENKVTAVPHHEDKDNRQRASTSPTSDTTMLHKVQTEETVYIDRKVLKTTEKKEHQETNVLHSIEKIGFPESSCLSVIQTCTDIPSLMCHCKNKPSRSVPDLDTSNYNLRAYETAPNLSTHSKYNTQIPKGLHSRETNNANDSLESFYQESDSETQCQCHEKKNDYVVRKCPYKHHEASQSYSVSQRLQPHIEDSRCEEVGIQTEVKSHCHCRQSVTSGHSENTIPELYAAKVRVSSEAVPKRFVFNAVSSSKYQDKGKNEPRTIRCEKPKKKCFFQLPVLNKSHKFPFNTIGENEFWEPISTKQNIDDCQGKLKKQSSDDDTYIHPYGHERIEVYYFDHGCSGYFRTTDYPPSLTSNIVVEKVDKSATRFWAEIFGIFHIITTFIIAFILQFLRFIFYSIIRPLLVGIIQITSDYFFKPLLAILFNGILQPILIFIYNITSSVKDICELIALTIGYFLREIALVCRAIRLVDVRNNTRNGPFITSKDQKAEV